MKDKSKARKVGKHRSLVQRLRKTCQRADQSGNRDDYALTNHTVWMLAEKLDAVGEALAYLIEKKHMKRRVKQRGG